MNHPGFESEFGDNFSVEVTGSGGNSLWSGSSDVDLVIVFWDYLHDDIVNIMKSMLSPLRNVADKRSIECVFKARIPVLKFVEKESKISVDITCNNTLPIHNTRLIYEYCLFDQRAHIMMITIKNLFKNCGIIDAANGNLSSYAICNMIIAFLQHRNILPNIQAMTKGKKLQKIKSVKRDSKNSHKFVTQEYDLDFESSMA